MQAPFYLTFGSLAIEAGSGAGPYHVISMRLPAPDPDGFGDWRPAQREFRIRVDGANPVTVASNVAALRQSLVRGAPVTLQVAPTTVALTTRIRESSAVESEFDPLERSVSTGPKMYVTVTLTTDPHWLAPLPAWTVISSPIAAPYHFDVPAAGGEDDALLSVRFIPSIATSGIYLGGWPNPAAGYDYHDSVYSGSLSVGATWTRATTGASAINALANRGQHLPLLYSSGSGIPASTAIRSALQTTGYAFPTAYTDTGPARLSDTLGRAVELARVTIPGTAIPEGINGSSFTVTHFIEFNDSTLPTISPTAVARIPLDYAALAYRATTQANIGIVYDGDTDTVHIGDADGIGYAVMADADIIRPLRASAAATTRIVYGVTASDWATSPTIGWLAYRVRRRFLSATG